MFSHISAWLYFWKLIFLPAHDITIHLNNSASGCRFVVFCYGLVLTDFIHIIQDYFTGTGVIIYPDSSEADPGPLFIKQTDVLPQDLVKSRSREIRV